MFLITDGLEARERKIRDFLKKGEPAIAVLLAAADCERTLRRAILSLGTTPTKELAYRLGRRPRKGEQNPIPKRLKYGATIKEYDRAWKDEVYPWWPTELKGGVVKDWGALEKAFTLRHELIHGDTGTTGVHYGEAQVDALIAATRAVHNFALAEKYDLVKRLKTRRKPRQSK